MVKCNNDGPEEVIAKLKRVIKNMEQLQTDFLDAGITQPQARILLPILEFGRGHTLQELTDFAKVDKAFVSRAVSDLEEKGLVKRDKDPDGKKNYKYNIILTDEGQRLFATIFEKHKANFQKMQSEISKTEMNIFLKVLNKLSQ